MRKLAWFVIIVLIVSLAIAIGCLLSPTFSAGMYNIGVNTIGLGLVKIITGLMTGMMAWGSINLAQATAVALGWGIGFTILWLLVLRKYIWNPLRNAPSAIKGTTVTLRGGPEPELPQSIEQAKPVEVKKEE